jgi:hypothetical protein
MTDRLSPSSEAYSHLDLLVAPSNDQCEQFNNADSYHQHRKRDRIVIEPMPPLYIHDATLFFGSHLPELNPALFSTFAFRAARRARQDGWGEESRQRRTRP